MTDTAAEPGVRTFDWREFHQRATTFEGKADLSRAAAALETAIELCDDEGALAELHGSLGEILERRGELERAVESYNEALALHKSGMDWAGIAVSQRRLGSVFQRQGDFKWAQSALGDAEIALRNVDDNAARADVFLQLGLLHEERGHYTDAVDECQRALKLARDIGDAQRTARALTGLGSATRENGNTGNAVEHLTEALALAAGTSDTLQVIHIQNLLGATLEDQGHSNEALSHYKVARDLSYEIDYLPGKAASLRRIGSAHAHKGDLAEAMQVFQDAVSMFTELHDDKGLSDLHSHIGEVHEQQGNLERAIESYNQALYLDRRDGDEVGMAGALRRLGSAYHERGQGDRAQDAFAEAERLLKRSDDEVELAILYTTWGRLYEEQGKFIRARDTYSRALAMNESKANDVGIASCLRHHASVLIELGDLDAAVADLGKAAQIHDRLGNENRPELVQITMLLGVAECERGRMAKALTHLEAAARLTHSPDNPTARSECLRWMGMAFVELGDYARAHECYDDALGISRDLDDAVALSDLYVQIGELYAVTGELSRAVDAYQTALDLDQGHGDKLGMARALRQLGAAYQDSGAFERAHESLKTAERLLNQSDDKNELSELHLQMGHLEEERGQFRRARELYSRALSGFRQTDDADGERRCHRRQASVLLRSGRAREAADLLAGILGALRGGSVDDRPERLEVLLLIGECHLSLAQPESALRSFRSAQDDADHLNSMVTDAACKRAIGRAQARLGAYGEAVRSLEEAVRINGEIEDWVAQAESLADLGEALEGRGDARDLDAAIDCFKRGLRLCRRFERTEITVQTLVLLGRACRRDRRHEMADECLSEAAELAKPLEGSEWRARIHLERGLLEMASGTDRSSIDSAEESLRRALDLMHERELSKTVNDAREALVTVRLKKNDIGGAMEHLRRLARARPDDPAASPWRHLLKELYDGLDDEVGSAFEEGKYQAAVQVAFRLFEDRVRIAADDGTTADAGYDPSTFASSVVRVADARLTCEPFRSNDELMAFSRLCAASYAGLRNPASHHNFPLSATDAFCILAMIHLMTNYLFLEDNRTERSAG